MKKVFLVQILVHETGVLVPDYVFAARFMAETHIRLLKRGYAENKGIKLQDIDKYYTFIIVEVKCDLS